MVSRDVAALFMEHTLDDEIRSLRDSIAKTEAELTAPMWERHRELHGRIEELKGKCEEAAAHSLTIVLAGKVGTRRRLMRNGRNERRTCLLCGSEEVGQLATGLLRRFLVRKAVWKFEKLKRDAARTFSDPEWYLETCSIIRNFSFSNRCRASACIPSPRTVFLLSAVARASVFRSSLLPPAASLSPAPLLGDNAVIESVRGVPLPTGISSVQSHGN